MLENWNYWVDPSGASHFGRPETRITLGGHFDAGDAGADVLKAAQASHSVVRLAQRLSWRKRLFSWPWRPWVSTEVLCEQAMVVGEPHVSDDGEVTFTFVQAPPE